MLRHVLFGVCLLALIAGTGGRSVYGQSAPPPPLPSEKALTQLMHTTWLTDQGLPQNTVNAIAQTSDGYLWLGTQEGLVRFDGIFFDVYDASIDAVFGSNNVRALLADHTGGLWIGTHDAGLLRYDGHTFTPVDSLVGARIIALLEDPSGGILVASSDGLGIVRDGRYVPVSGLPDGRIAAIATHPTDSEIWVALADGRLLRQTSEGHFEEPYATRSLPTRIQTMTFAPDGALWLGTAADGLVRIHENRFSRYTRADGYPSNAISSLLPDPSGQLWVGSSDAGLFRLSYAAPAPPRPRYDQLTEAPGKLHGSHIKSLLIDQEGSLWLGVDGGGLNQLREGKVTPFTTEHGLIDNHVYPIYEDPSGAIWFGTTEGATRLAGDGTTTSFTTENGLPANFVLALSSTPDGSVWLGTSGGLVQYREGRFRTFTAADGLVNDYIYGLYAARDGTLWIATGNGLSHLVEGTFVNYTTKNGLSTNFVTVMKEDRQGTLWIGTYDKGLMLLRDGQFLTLTTRDGLSSNGILSLHEDDAGTLWVGTYGGGLNRVSGGTITPITSRDGLFNDKVSQILEDDRRTLWISSNKGLYTVSRDELDAFAAGKIDRVHSTLYDRHDGLPSQEFIGGIQPAGWKSRDGRFWFPSVAGAVQVDPRALRTNTIPPPVHIKGVEFNKPHELIDGVITLPAGTTRFAFHYAAITFVSPHKTRYQVKLEGEDEDWIDAGSLRDAPYRNLGPGTYTLRVRAQNADGVWSVSEARYQFDLEPFFYQRGWFFVVVGLLFFITLIGGNRLSVAHMKARQRELQKLVDERTYDLKCEKEKTEEAKAVIEAQADQLRELDRFKTRFFANVSHEFRTPLTMIIGPLENALGGVYGAIDPALGRQLDIMRRNALRLMRLINQLLDLSKLEAGKMQLKTRPLDIVRFLQDVLLTVSPFAEKKDIALGFSSDQPSVELYFEPDKFEKVFYNLLSNAAKFTPAGGRIAMDIHTLPARETAPQGVLEVRVSDTGKGIPADQLPYIFDRFHQVDGSNTREHEGTGIGLALVKEMIELHGGSVRVESTPGAGTTFIIELLLGANHLTNEQVSTDAGGYTPDSGTAFDETPAPAAVQRVAEVRSAPPAHAPLLLIVDDNPDLRDYLESILGDRYRIIQAKDGLEGLEMAREHRPNLIVSDVMMPRMDGHALCRAIKGDDQLRHTPLILLTARATSEMMLEGLEEGADDYMAKPFNARELHARVHNLLVMREQQQQLSLSNEALRESNIHLTRANESLVQRTAELLAALDKNNEILGVASHDLKNPLAGILGLAELILESIRESTDDDMKAEALECITLLHSEADRMLRIIKELLDKHREGERLELRKESIDLNDIVETALRWNHQQASQKRIDIHFDRQQTVAVEVDIDAIMRVVDNLVSNAVKYSPPGSEVWVHLDHEASGALLRVEDQGPGLTQEDLHRVFGKGQQLSAKPTAGEHSSGLGLYIVKQLVEQHQGEVGVESEAGQGATFWVRLPALELDATPIA